MLSVLFASVAFLGRAYPFSIFSINRRMNYTLLVDQPILQLNRATALTRQPDH